MKQSTKAIFEELFVRVPALSCAREDIFKANEVIDKTYSSGGTLFLCGNGGSAADSEHIVGELMKSFKRKRPIKEEERAFLQSSEEGCALIEVLEGGLQAISLTSHLSLSTAFSNDKEPAAVFAQQLYVLGKKGDALLSISTSGNSQNCVYAATVAKMKGISTIALTGEQESKLSSLCKVSVRVPETETYKIQELHLPVYHALCAMLENEYFGE